MEPSKQEILDCFKSDHLEMFANKTKTGEWFRLPGLTEQEDEQVRSFSEAAAKEKVKENGHKNDFDKEYLRIYNGKCAEWSLRKHIGLEPPDMNIGPSHRFKGEDLVVHGLKLGIKCSIAGQAALVFKEPKMPEIIIVQKGSSYYMCGIAGIELMRRFNDDMLKKSATNTSKGGLTMLGYGNLCSYQTFDRIMRSKEKTSKITGSNMEKTCEDFLALSESEGFIEFLNDYKKTKKALSE